MSPPAFDAKPPRRVALLSRLFGPTWPLLEGAHGPIWANLARTNDMVGCTFSSQERRCQGPRVSEWVVAPLQSCVGALRRRLNPPLLMAPAGVIVPGDLINDGWWNPESPPQVSSHHGSRFLQRPNSTLFSKLEIGKPKNPFYLDQPTVPPAASHVRPRDF